MAVGLDSPYPIRVELRRVFPLVRALVKDAPNQSKRGGFPSQFSFLIGTLLLSSLHFFFTRADYGAGRRF